MSGITHITDDTFQPEVTESSQPVLVDFWAEWCGPCRKLGPILEEFAAEHGDKVKVAKMNVDENQSTPQSFGIMGIPTMILFAGGAEKKRIVGAIGKAKIESELSQWLEQ